MPILLGALSSLLIGISDTLFFMTLGLNVLSRRIVKRFRETYE